MQTSDTLKLYEKTIRTTNQSFLHVATKDLPETWKIYINSEKYMQTKITEKSLK